jgi:DNA-binding NtrC family response regulator
LKSDIIDIKESIDSFRSSVKKEEHYDGFHIPKDAMNKMTLDDIEREVISFLLYNNGWNVEHVALQLNQTSRNIYKKMKKYNITKEDRWRR